MPPHSIALRYAAAQGLAREAGAVAKQRFLNSASFTLNWKGHQDYLTEVDGEIEALVRGRLTQLFPEDAFLGEEGGISGKAGAPGTWVVDPIDGTANFARGIPRFCISMAFVADGKTELGITYDPMMDELFHARRGGGAFLNGRAIKVSAAEDLRRSSIEIGWNMRSGTAGFLDITARVIAMGAGMIRCGSGAIGIAYVAAGRTDGYAEQHMNSWDALAGLCLVAEAGGHVNDYLAKDGLIKGNEVLACAPGLTSALREASRIVS